MKLSCPELRIICAIVCCCIHVCAAYAQHFEVAPDLLLGRRVAKWRGALISRSDSERIDQPIVRIIGENGIPRDLKVDIPGAVRLVVSDALLAGSDGSVIIAGEAWSATAQLASVIAFLQPDGSTRLVRRMNPFHVYRIARVSDTLLWAFGQPIADGNQGLENDHTVFQAIRIADGVTVASHTLASSVSRLRRIPVASNPASDGTSTLFAGSERVGLYLASPKQWAEYGPEGQALGTWTLPPPVVESASGPRTLSLTGMAYTAANRLIAYFRDHSDWSTAGYYELDRAAGSWKRLPGIDAAKYAMLLGAEGTRILVMDLPPNTQVWKYRWIETAAESAKQERAGTAHAMPALGSALD